MRLEIRPSRTLKSNQREQLKQSVNRSPGKARCVHLINSVALTLSLFWLIRIALTVKTEDTDLGQYRQAAVNILQTGDPYATTPEPCTVKAPSDVRPKPYPNPPLFAYLMLPFAKMELWTTVWAWYAGNLLMLAALCLITIRISGSTIAARYWGVIWLLLVYLGPARLCLQLGQLGIFLALLAITGYALSPKYGAAAGLAFTLGAFVKLYPGFLGLYLLRSGARRVTLWSTGWAFGILVLSLVLHGPGPYFEYFRKILTGCFYPYPAEFNVSLIGFWRRLLTANDYTVALANMPRLAFTLSLASTLVVLVLCWRVGPGGNGRVLRLQFATYCSAMLLISPVDGYYNLPLLIFPALTVLGELERCYHPRLPLWFALAIALISVAPTWTDRTSLYYPMHMGWGTLILTPAVQGQTILLGMVSYLARQAFLSEGRIA